MNLDYTAVVIAVLAAILSGMGTAVIAGLRDNRKEKILSNLFDKNSEST